MGSFFTSPTLMAIGAGLIALPIIIHLLNRRRFKRVDWGAMEFLLEASRINKRRVQLQDLLLLLMRCLAVLLIAALIARPFFTQDAGGDLRSGRFERVVILDDSPSMDSVDGGKTPFGRAKEQLEGMVKSLAENNTEDSLTLYLASAPDAPVISGEPINPETLATRLDAVRSLKAADVGADYRRALEGVARSVARAKQEQNNQILYIMTDFRARDWKESLADAELPVKEGGEEGGETTEPTEPVEPPVEGGEPNPDDDGRENLIAEIKALAPDLSALYIVGIEAGDTSNVLVESVVCAEATIIAGVTTKFLVTVRNTGKTEARDLRLSFKAGLSLPVEEEIESIPAGGSKEIPINFTFAAETRDELLDEKIPDKGVEVVVAVSPIERSGQDVLEPDNTFYFPARVSSGIRTLIVDGDPSSLRGKSDSYFLRKALSPRGRIVSGVSPDVVSENEFGSTKLADYQVIFLLNVNRINEVSDGAEKENDTISKLEKWVENGGGLGIALGGNTDEDIFEQEFYKEGAGLSPVNLLDIRGDEKREKWVFIDPIEDQHPILRLFEGEDNPMIKGVKVFRWWSSEVDPISLENGVTRLLGKWTDEEGSPAIVEKRFGEGRVLTFTTPLDLDWSDWPQDAPSYLITMQEAVRYLSQSAESDGLLAAGQPIEMPLDLTRYREGYTVKPPEGEIRNLVALRPETEDAAPESSVLKPWKIEVEETRKRGFYELALTPSSRPDPESILYAVNLDPTEGELQLVEGSEVQVAMGDAPVTVVSGADLARLGANTAKLEIWRPVLYVLLGLLILELFYGWWLGVKRGA